MGDAFFFICSTKDSVLTRLNSDSIRLDVLAMFENEFENGCGQESGTFYNTARLRNQPAAAVVIKFGPTD